MLGNAIAKLFILLIVWLILLIPAEFIAVFYWLVNPESDLVRFLVLGAGVFFLGAIQFFLFIGGLFASYMVITKPL